MERESQSFHQHPPWSLQRPVMKGELCVNVLITLGLLYYLNILLCAFVLFCGSGGCYVFPQYIENSKVVTSWVLSPPWGENVALCHMHLSA